MREKAKKLLEELEEAGKEMNDLSHSNAEKRYYKIVTELLFYVCHTMLFIEPLFFILLGAFIGHFIFSLL